MSKALESAVERTAVKVPLVQVSCDGFKKHCVSIPQIGFGTWKLTGETAERAVKAALQEGYTHVDTAQVYRNEHIIGSILYQSSDEDSTAGSSGLISKKKKVWITSKLSPKKMKSEDTMRSSIEESLGYFNGFIDCFLIHWPGKSGKKPSHSDHRLSRMKAWLILEEYFSKGYFGCIGVSNFEVNHLKELINAYENGIHKYRPCLNQFELHPCFYPCSLIQYCLEHEIAVCAYCSLGGSMSESLYFGSSIIIDDTSYLSSKDTTRMIRHELSQLSESTGLTKSSLLLKWALQKGFIILPKSTKLSRIRDNLRVLFLKDLSQTEMKIIDSFRDVYHQKVEWDPSSVL